MELGEVAKEGGLGEGAPDEGVHRLGDAFEREHLRDEQVHDVGLDAGAVLQGSRFVVGAGCDHEAGRYLGVLDAPVGSRPVHRHGESSLV